MSYGFKMLQLLDYTVTLFQIQELHKR